MSNDKTGWISTVVGIGCGALSALIFFPLMKRSIAELEEQQ